MARPVFIPIHEEDESVIRDRMLGRISEEWRKERGDFIYDAVAPSPLEIKQLEANQDEILKQSFAQFAEGEYLDYKLDEVGLTRDPATANKRTLSIVADAGVVIPLGHTLSTVVLDTEGNPIEYTVDAAVTFLVTGPLEVDITCKLLGVIGNVSSSSEFILSPSLPGVRSITDLGTVIPGADQESDESAWIKYDFKIKNPDTGGNKNDYVRWATEIEAVGMAKCIPRWDGVGTVKVIIVNTDYAPAAAEIVDEVQAYLDPGSQGLGEGKAPCGAEVTVAAATSLIINIVATIEIYAGAIMQNVEDAFEAAVRAYLKSIVFTGNSVAIAKIGSLLISTYGVSNYSLLTLNGAAIDVPVAIEQVATLGAITI